MKTTKQISMQQFMSEVGKIAAKLNKNYFSAYCEMNSNTQGLITYNFKCYVTGYSFYEGKTPNEALEKLKDATLPTGSKIQDVTLEMYMQELDKPLGTPTGIIS